MLEGLARASEIIEFDTGATIVREGEQGHHYFVIASGSVEVHVGATRTRRMSRSEGFGEIALLGDLPRTATVTACEPVTVLAVERGRFLAAVTGHEGSASVAWAVARELHPPLTAQFDT